MMDPEAAVFGVLVGKVSPVHRGPIQDTDPDDIARVIGDGGFTPQYLYGGGSVSNDDVQVIVRSTRYEEGRARCMAITSALSPVSPDGVVVIQMTQPFLHFRTDGDDRHYFSARFLCRIEN